MSDLGSKTALQADCDAKVTTNGANENTGTRVRAFLTNVIDTLYANFQESSGNTATASTVNLGALKSKITLTGTTTITSFGTADVGVTRTCIAAGVFQITHHNTNLIIPGGANVTTALEDVFVAVSHGSGSWQIVSYTRRDGSLLVSEVDNNLTASTTRAPSKTAVNGGLAQRARIHVAGALSSASPVIINVAGVTDGSGRLIADLTAYTPAIATAYLIGGAGLDENNPLTAVLDGSATAASFTVHYKTHDGSAAAGDVAVNFTCIGIPA